MKVFLWPAFGEESGQGGIKRVWEAQRRYLPEFGVEIVDDQNKADLINIHAEFLETDLPTAFSCHGLYWEGYKWERWPHEVNARILAAMKRSEAISVPSQWVHTAVARGALLDPFVIPHGINIEEWTPIKHAGYVSWLKNRPDPICDPTVVNALASICQDIRFATTFGEQTPNVSVAGKLHYLESKMVLSQSVAYLATVMETGGITVMEAMAAGVPPLGYAHGANLELITHLENGFLVEPGDVRGLREGLYYILENRDRLSDAARQTAVERFQWKDRIQGYLPFYRAALEAKKPVKVSVVVTAYNLEEYLPGCLDSILEQDMQDWELIVVDDASPDRCGEIADGYAKRDSRIKVIHNSQNVYLAEARNIGFSASSGQYLLPLDADDRISPSALRVLAEALDKYHHLDIVTGGFQVIRPDGSSFVSGWPPPDPSYNMQIIRRNQVPYASLYRRWVWERTGGYRRRMRSAEDAEFWTRAMSFGAVPAKITDVPTLIYNDRPNSMSHTEAEPDWNSWYTWAIHPELTPSGASGNPPNGISWPVHTYGPPRISVIIPVGPGHDIYLQDSLDSLIAQTYLEWEVIVVNDTGFSWHDNDGKLINPYLSGYPFARIIDIPHDQPKGPAWARNQGIAAARALLFVPLDADDIAQPLMLESLYKAHDNSGGWVYMDWFKGDGSREEAKSWSGPELMNRQLGPITGIYRVSDWELVGGFDEEAPGWEDWDFQLMLLEEGVCGTRLAHPLLIYRYDTGQRREDSFARKDEALEYIEQKHARLYQDRSYAEMGCGCGAGGGKADLTIYAPTEMGVAGSNDDPSNWVTVEYIGTPIQMRTMHSSTNRGRTYRYGGEPGSPERTISVLREDASLFLSRPNDFRVIESAPQKDYEVNVAVRAAPANTPAIFAERKPVAIDRMGLRVLAGKIPPEVITLLEEAGYKNVLGLRSASKADLLAIKGIGDRRANQIMGAVGGLH